MVGGFRLRFLTQMVLVMRVQLMKSCMLHWLGCALGNDCKNPQIIEEENLKIHDKDMPIFYEFY